MKDKTMEQIKSVENYITELFDHYNGIINTFNYPAKLKFDHESDYVALSKYPDTVYINIPALFGYTVERYGFDKFLDYIDFTMELIIVHELYHLDQLMTYKDSLIVVPKNDLEAQVMYKSLRDSDILDEERTKIFQEYKSDGYYESMYFRKNFIDHVLELFLYQTTDPEILSPIKDLLSNKPNVYIVAINKSENKQYLLQIKSDNKFIDIDEFNEFVKSKIYKPIKESFDIYFESDKIILELYNLDDNED